MLKKMLFLSICSISIYGADKVGDTTKKQQFKPGELFNYLSKDNIELKSRGAEQKLLIYLKK